MLFFSNLSSPALKEEEISAPSAEFSFSLFPKYFLIDCSDNREVFSSIRIINCSEDISKEKIAAERFTLATFNTKFSARAVLPTDGRAAKIIKLPG